MPWHKEARKISAFIMNYLQHLHLNFVITFILTEEAFRIGLGLLNYDSVGTDLCIHLATISNT